nr:MAG TPA: hypothetical protein [Caudoviricetes sp.]
MAKKKIYKFDNLVTLYVEAGSMEMAVRRLNERLNRMVNRDVCYLMNGDLQENIITKEERKAEFEAVLGDLNEQSC